MQARIASIKSTLRRPEPVTQPAVTLARSGGREFLRMALVAVASGLVFGIVSGLVVWLVASHQHFDDAEAALANAPQAVESR
ncbi:MAG: hypothetical protein JNM76_00250 [Betaproteobacteria bacterium]|nr:hypothetical protein [Betaproteobacteria bacterium]